MPSAAAAASCRKKRRQTWLPSCLFHSCVYDPDDSPAKPARRVRRQSKAAPLSQQISRDGEGFIAEAGGMKQEISPPANCQKGMPEKVQKTEKRWKLSSPCSNKRCISHHSCMINHQLAVPIHKANRRGPVQSRTRTKTIHSGWSAPTRLSDSNQSYTKPDSLAGLKMIILMLVTILIGGKIFAVFITTICFYILSCAGLSRSPMLMAPTRKKSEKGNYY